MKSRILVINENPLFTTVLAALINNTLVEKGLKHVELTDAAGDMPLVCTNVIPGTDVALKRVMQVELDKTIYIQPASEIPYTGSIYLRRKYGNPNGNGEHMLFTRYKWRRAVGNHQTILGYWDWVEHKLNRKPIAEQGASNEQ